MDIKNLEIKIYKNYKELCECLGVEPKPTGNPRKSQIKDFEQYFEFKKIEGSQQIMITNIYKNKKEKTDFRKLGGRSKYINEIGDILIDYLYKEGEKSNRYSRTLSLGKTLEILGMVNLNYAITHRHKRETSEVLDVNIFSVHYFFNNTRSEYRKIVERALNNLQSRRVLNWNKCIQICEDKDGGKIYRKSTKEEEVKIINIEKQVLQQLNIRSMQELFFGGNVRRFNKLVKEQLPSNWLFYFYAYDLTIGDEAIKIEQKLIQKSKQALNKKSKDKAIKLLKTDENKDEYKLIELLIDLLNYDFELGDDVKKMYEKNSMVRFAKMWNAHNKYEADLDRIEAEFHKDIEMCDYFGYIANSKEKKLQVNSL